VRFQRLGLRRLARLARLNLDHLDRAESQRPTGRGGAFGIVPGQQGFRNAAKPTDGEEGDFHDKRLHLSRRERQGEGLGAIQVRPETA